MRKPINVQLGLWWNASVQKELEGAKSNKTAFSRIAKEMNEMRYEWAWQQCQVKPKNIISNYREIMGSSKMHAKQIDLFLLFCTLRCFHHKYIVLLVNVACNKAKSLLNGHMNVILSRV